MCSVLPAPCHAGRQRFPALRGRPKRRLQTLRVKRRLRGGERVSKQKCISLFDDQLEVVSFLNDEQLGRVVRAAMQFMRDGTDACFDGCEGMFYRVLLAQFVRQQIDQKNRACRCKRENRENRGSKSRNPSGRIEKEPKRNKGGSRGAQPNITVFRDKRNKRPSIFGGKAFSIEW